jgi:uncharacterized protein YbjT (DUF2867 family)
MIPAFGGGTAMVQPVDVTDVARAVALTIEDQEILNATIELGGPEILAFADFLRRIRSACGYRPAPLLFIPVGPTRSLLKAARVLLGERLPISPGQLSPFINDGTATPSALRERLLPSMRTLDDLLANIARAP